MIVQCESCQSKFNLDEALIKEEGTKVRCSLCKSVFTVYPSQPETDGEQAVVQDLNEELEETVALDSPPVFDQEEEEFPGLEEDSATDFDQAFQEAIEEEGLVEVGLAEPAGEEETDIEEALGRAEKIEEDLSLGDQKVQGRKVKIEKAPARAPGKKKSGTSKLFLSILFIILFLIIACGAVYFFLPKYLPGFLSSQKPVPTETLTDQGVKNLTFKEVSGSFIQSEVAGRRFVVRGRVLNNYPDPRSYVLVKAEILDEKDQVIRRKLAYAGNVFTENELKNMPMTEIDKILKDRMGRNQMNLNIMPKADVPFMVIFEDLPRNLSEFSVEAVSSSPGE